MIIKETEKDVTEQARAKGWTLGKVSVRAALHRDVHLTPDGADCYDAVSRAAWERDEWGYVGLVVTVTDDDGREWGFSSLWGIEYGAFPITDESGTLVETKDLDPLNPSTVDYHLSDVMREALGNAAEALAAFAPPVVLAPENGVIA